MKRFDRGASCPKCGSVGATARFLAAEKSDRDFPLIAEIEALRGKTPPVERIRRDCTTCGYWWLEAPIDAAEVTT